jgi:hypothetical protein
MPYLSIKLCAYFLETLLEMSLLACPFMQKEKTEELFAITQKTQRGKKCIQQSLN